ncbi:MAG: D-glycerate dehydrogenase [Chloroflexi bacterium]|nr:D-glycerate dehydrogenase [Chloroflexota bacterium]
MQAPTVVIPAPFNATLGLEERLTAAGYTVIVGPAGPREDWTPEEIERYAAADVILASPFQKFGADVLKAAKNLRLIGSPVIGFDHIDIDTATELGILVSNCPTEEIIVGMAESTVMLIAALSLELVRKQARIRAGGWRGPSDSHLVRGKTVGLVGYGRIGRAVAQRLQGWDVTIQIYDPYVPNSVPLDVLLQTSDVVSIHTPRTPETIGLIGAREIGLMKPSAILINTARGSIVDEVALAAAIDEKRIFGAAMDAWDQEPTNLDNPLFRCDPDRVILTPHSVGHSLEIGPAGVEMAFRTVTRVLEGELPESVANPQVIERWQARFGGRV